MEYDIIIIIVEYAEYAKAPLLVWESGSKDALMLEWGFALH